jgi:HAE1 family hydrophobic/amphiphilic exporter-1
LKSIVNFALKNKLAVWIMTILLITTGIYSGTKMKMEILPELEIPYLLINTMYIGGTPEEIDKSITEPLEQRLKNLDSIKMVKSTSSNNVSLVTLEFDYGVDIEKVKNNVQKEIDKVSVDFDERISDSEIIEINLNTLPVYSLSTTSEKLNSSEMSKLVEEDLLTKLTSIEGVSSVEMGGATKEQIVMKYKQNVLAQYKITEDTIEKLIQGNSLNIPLGLLEFEETEESVIVQGKKESLEQLRDLPLPFRDQQGKNLLLSDFVDLEKVQIKDTISRVNGEESISLNVVKAQSANTVDVVNKSKEIIKEFEEKNKDISINILMDQAEPIEESITTMLSKALFGAMFAIFIIMLFLRDAKSTFISVVSIPVSLILSLAVLYKLGITLNTMTLGAMTVAIGRVIDDSIVVVENIYRRLNDKNEKLKGKELIKEATLEMFVPILSSTMVTIAVFLPLGLVGGFVGQLFLPFALAMAFSLLASLLVAITIVPAMAHSLFKKELAGDGKQHKEKESKITKIYVKGLKWTLNHKAITLIISLLLVGGSLALTPKLGFGFLPNEADKQWALSYTPGNGEKEESVEKALYTAEDYLLNIDEIEQIQSTLGSSGGLMSLGNANGGMTLIFKDTAIENDMEKTKQEILTGLEKLDIKGQWTEAQGGPSAGLSSNQISYSLYGKTIEDLNIATKQVEVIMNKNKDIKNVASDISEVYKENRLVIDEDKTAAYGLTTVQVGMSLSTLSRDKEITKIVEQGKETKVIIKGENKSYNNINEILEKELVNMNGMVIQVKDVVKVEESVTVSSIKKDDGKLVGTITAEVLVDDVKGVSTEIEKGINELELPKGVELVEGGVGAQMTEAFVQMGLAMLAAIGIVYLLLVLTFKEGLAPFAILFSLPLTIIGVVIILFITGLTVDVSAMLGLLMLIGIVVTNAIVLVDRVLKNEYEGMEMREAILEGSQTRIRPILMTAIATIGALLPLAFGTEGGGLISQGLGVTVIGGLISSTVLTLFIVPVIYELLSKVMKKDRKNNNK